MYTILEKRRVSNRVSNQREFNTCYIHSSIKVALRTLFIVIQGNQTNEEETENPCYNYEYDHDFLQNAWKHMIDCDPTNQTYLLLYAFLYFILIDIELSDSLIEHGITQEPTHFKCKVGGNIIQVLYRINDILLLQNKVDYDIEQALFFDCFRRNQSVPDEDDRYNYPSIISTALNIIEESMLTFQTELIRQDKDIDIDSMVLYGDINTPDISVKEKKLVNKQTIEQIKRILDDGQYLIFGLSSRKETTEQGHAVTMIDYDITRKGKLFFIFKNSWGKEYIEPDREIFTELAEQKENGIIIDYYSSMLQDARIYSIFTFLPVKYGTIGNETVINNQTEPLLYAIRKKNKMKSSSKSNTVLSKKGSSRRKTKKNIHKEYVL